MWNCSRVIGPEASTKLARSQRMDSFARTARESWLTCSFAFWTKAPRRLPSSFFWTRQKMPSASAKEAASGSATERQRFCQTSRGLPKAMSPMIPKSQTPSVSPTHQVHQFINTATEGTTPATQRVVTPHVAETRHAMGPPNPMKEKISLLRIKAAGQPANRRTSHAPANACKEAPMPMLAATRMDLTMPVRLEASKQSPVSTQKEPSQTPGQQFKPNWRRPTRAKPEEGQMAMPYFGGTAISRPSLPAMK